MKTGRAKSRTRSCSQQYCNNRSQGFLTLTLKLKFRTVIVGNYTVPLMSYLPRDAHQKSSGGSLKSDCEIVYSIMLETVKNQRIHTFPCNMRQRVLRG